MTYLQTKIGLSTIRKNRDTNNLFSRRIRRVSHNPLGPVILSRLFEYGASQKVHSGKTDVLDVQLIQSKCMISAENVNKSGSFYTEIK